MKFIINTLFIVASIIVILGLIGQYRLSTRWESYLTKNELLEMAVKIKATKPIPDKFLNAYYKMHPNCTLSVNTFLLKSITHLAIKNSNREDRFKSPFVSVLNADWRLIENKKFKRTFLTNVEIGYGLEKYVKAQECLNHSIRIEYSVLKRYQEGYKFQGIELDSLTNEQIIDYFIAEPGPTVYSPRINYEHYSNRKKTVENILADK